MSPAETAFWQRAMRRAQGLQPELQAAILRAFAIIRDSLSEAELARVISSGYLDKLFAQALSQALLDRAFQPLRQRIRKSTERSFRYVISDLPRGGRIDGELAVMFDHLDPKVIEAIRSLESKIIKDLQADIRDTVKAYVENGLRAGSAPSSIARDLRSVIGLSPTQMEQSLAYGEKLAAQEMTQAEEQAALSTYIKRRIAQNAETNARTAALDSMKMGQRLSWQAAVDNGVVPPGRLVHQWIGVMDDRERPEHVAMEKETQPFDVPYSNGELVPGESTYNCRCIDRVFIQRT